MERPRIVVAGGGHNGLVAAVLAASAGADVEVLEAADHVGGATQGAQLFAGHPARLSRYSYLVSLFPTELVDRLCIDLRLARRAVSSYTPVGAGGLLVERDPGPATAASFRALTGSDAEFAAWRQLSAELGVLARAVAPALTGPLRRRSQVRSQVLAAGGDQIWGDVVEAPIGEMILRRFADDTVRGVVATDALIGTHTSLLDPSLLANRCFLYHVTGRGTGDWLVPVGGMGALTDALLARCAELGVRIRTGAEVTALADGDDGVEVDTADGDRRAADAVLAAAAPAAVDRWLGRPAADPEGAQLKINMLLRRLPRLRSGVDPAIAFAGTVHLSEGWAELEDAYRRSAAGLLPDPLPAEVYCHSLTDPSVLGASAGDGTATLTLFGLHTPARLFAADSADPSAPERAAAARERAVAAALASLQRHLAEPLTDCLAVDLDGRPCLDVATPVDLERDLRMPGGHIFHGDLRWPWLEDGGSDGTADGSSDDSSEGTGSGGSGDDGSGDDGSGDDMVARAARRYGVGVAGCRRVLQAGSGSVRGGAVSGLGGLAAVDALRAAGLLPG
ncbi:phytoene desaturase family protein [Nakamurella endophytica]|uniref:Pyridine nucleotide-disulfide oxidoreductase domain-containing protein 2 n=1 Tax=Nakamurella endophytica TaxID=1748367 RepID=A0A917WAE6_9ACTN|nr:FAD-dependent oxidoreductase [Nakamurella endophytica]GGL85654.1 oxidoreductase [Nakamurella endophytica]